MYKVLMPSIKTPIDLELCSKAISGKFGVIKNSQKGQFLCTRLSHFEHIVAKCGVIKLPLLPI